jgi:hypothetical protein
MMSMHFTRGPLGEAILLAALLLSPTPARAMEIHGNLGVADGLKFQGAGHGVLFSDGSRQSSAAISCGRVRIVRPVGTPADNGAALLENLSVIADADAGRPYLVKIEPGTYDIGTSTLSMIPYVDIEGSGRDITIIKGQISGDTFDAGVVSGASHAELRYLSVVRSGGGKAGAAIVNDGASPDITDVTIFSSGATGANIGVYNLNASPRLRAVQVGAEGGGAAYGIGNVNSTVLISGGLINAAAGNLINIGVSNEDSQATIESFFIGVGGGVENFGVLNNSSDSVMCRVKITVVSGQKNVGIDNQGNCMAVMKHLDVQVIDGSNYNFGIRNGVSSVRLFGGTIMASGGVNASGLLIVGDDTLVQGTQVTAANGSLYSIGIETISASPLLTGASVMAEGSGGLNCALAILGDSGTVSVNNSLLQGSSKSIANSDGATVNVGASQLDGPIDTSVGSWHCSGCYDGSFKALGNDCK